MKAKIKKTGEIVNLASYATIALDQSDSWGNPIELKPEEVELMPDVTEDEHWQDVRERAAIAAMQGMMSNSELIYDKCDDIITRAIRYAHTLVEELKKK